MKTEKEIKKERERLSVRKRQNKFREREVDYFIVQIKEETLEWVLEK